MARYRVRMYLTRELDAHRKNPVTLNVQPLRPRTVEADGPTEAGGIAQQQAEDYHGEPVTVTDALLEQPERDETCRHCSSGDLCVASVAGSKNGWQAECQQCGARGPIGYGTSESAWTMYAYTADGSKGGGK